jgi:hypothetical protein
VTHRNESSDSKPTTNSGLLLRLTGISLLRDFAEYVIISLVINPTSALLGSFGVDMISACESAPDIINLKMIGLFFLQQANTLLSISSGVWNVYILVHSTIDAGRGATKGLSGS